MTQRIFINLGEVYFGEGDLHVETLLGSCVAIIFWHPSRRLGGLCHFLLPMRARHDAQAERDGRYGEDALAFLLDEIGKHGTRVSDYVVKVFGGGSLLGLPLSMPRVGHANANFALDALQQQHIKIVAQDVAGDGYRYLRFDLNNGDVWVRKGNGTIGDSRMVEALLNKDR